MEIRNYLNDEHFNIIQGWLKARGSGEWDEFYMPQMGFMAFHENTPVAAGFIRHCEGNVGILDSYVTNPAISSEIRNEALEKLTKELISTAEEYEYKYLLAFTQEDCIIERAMKHGFTQMKDTFLSLNLRGN